MTTRPETFPVSEAQWWVWYLHQSVGGDALTLRFDVDLPQPLNMLALKAAVGRSVLRHETLRSVFPVINGLVRQVILPPYSPKIAELEAETSLESFAAAALSDSPLDIHEFPPVRFLYSSTEGAPKLTVLIHHIICDGWSAKLLTQELLESYHSAAAGHSLDGAAIVRQPKDQALWEASAPGQAELASGLKYWQKRLAGAPSFPATLTSPWDAAGHRMELCMFSISPEIVAAAERLARLSRVTPYVVFLAVFRALLAAAIGQDDVVVASNHLNRRRPFLRTPGHFAKTLLFRDCVWLGQTFMHLVAAVACTSQEGASASRYSQAALYQWAIRNAFERGDAISPNFRVPPSFEIISFDFGPLSKKSPDSLTTRGEQSTHRFPRAVGLNMRLRIGHAGATGFFAIGDQIAKQVSARDLADLFLGLVQGVIQHPEAPLSAVLRELRPSLLRNDRRVEPRPMSTAACRRALLFLPEVVDCEIEPVEAAAGSDQILVARVQTHQPTSEAELKRRLFLLLDSFPGATVPRQIRIVPSSGPLCETPGDSAGPTLNNEVDFDPSQEPHLAWLAPGELSAIERKLMEMLPELLPCTARTTKMGVDVHDIPRLVASLCADDSRIRPDMLAHLVLPMTIPEAAAVIAARVANADRDSAPLHRATPR